MKLGLITATFHVALGLATGACSVETSSAPPPPTAPPPIEGALILDWTIDGSQDPNACAQSAATAIDVRVYDEGGGFVGEYQQACAAFSTSVALEAGSYTATAVLVDGAGNARTTTINVNPFVIQGNDQIDVPLDFPSTSFI